MTLPRYVIQIALLPKMAECKAKGAENSGDYLPAFQRGNMSFLAQPIGTGRFLASRLAQRLIVVLTTLFALLRASIQKSSPSQLNNIAR